jgi:hypothetical protein
MDPEPLATIRCLLADPNPEHRAEAVKVVADWAKATAIEAWGAAPHLPARERMLAVLRAIASAMEEIGVALEEDGREEARRGSR